MSQRNQEKRQKGSVSFLWDPAFLINLGVFVRGIAFCLTYTQILRTPSFFFYSVNFRGFEIVGTVFLWVGFGLMGGTKKVHCVYSYRLGLCCVVVLWIV
jgi:hypothetical protein